MAPPPSALEPSSDPARAGVAGPPLPPTEATAPLRAPGSARAVGPAIGLVVEDEPLLRMLVRDVLEEAGFEVTEAANAGAALAALASVPQGAATVLVTDVDLGAGPDGVALASWARRMRPGLPVLYVTGSPERVMAARGSLDATERLLAKPADPAAIARTAQDLVVGTAAAPTLC